MVTVKPRTCTTPDTTKLFPILSRITGVSSPSSTLQTSRRSQWSLRCRLMRRRFDFVQSLRGGSAVLIHFRNHSGFGVISFRSYKQPRLKPEPNYIHPASVQSDGPNTMLLISANGPNLQTQEQQYEVVNVANASDPTPLATIQEEVAKLLFARFTSRPFLSRKRFFRRFRSTCSGCFWRYFFQ